MTDQRDGGANARSLNDTIAGTGPGTPDDALAPDEQMPEPPSEADVARTARALGVTEPDMPTSDDEQEPRS